MKKSSLFQIWCRNVIRQACVCDGGVETEKAYRDATKELDAKLEIRSREEMLRRESSTEGRIEYLKKLVSTAEEMRC